MSSIFDAFVPYLGDIGKIAGGLIGSDRDDKAADAQIAAGNKAAELEKYMYDTSRADYAPYRESGQQANQLLSHMMGLQRRNAPIPANWAGGGATGGNSAGTGTVNTLPQQAGSRISSDEGRALSSMMGRQIYNQSPFGAGGRPNATTQNNIRRLNYENDADMEALGKGYDPNNPTGVPNPGAYRTKTPEQMDLDARMYSNMYSPGSDIGLSGIIGGAIRGGVPGAVMGGMIKTHYLKLAVEHHTSQPHQKPI